MTEQLKKSDFRFFHRLRVRWAEVDMQKIVFNAHYLMYFDTAIADYWRAIGLAYPEGYVDATVIHMITVSGEILTLNFNPLTGNVGIVSGDVPPATALAMTQ